MGQEIELSIAETNKLRAQLGLPLIPDGKDHLPDDSGKKSLSVDSANTLRKSLGLRPKVEMEKLKEDAVDGPKPQKKELSKNIPLFYNDVDSTDSWLANLGKPKGHKLKVSEIKKEKAKTEFKLAHDADAISALRDGDVFTLEDKDILEDEEDVLENDELRKLAKEETDRIEKTKQDNLKYGVPRVSDDISPSETVSSVTIRDNQIVFDSNNRDSEDVVKPIQQVSLNFDDIDQPKAPITMKKKSKSRKSSKKRLKEIDGIIEVSEPMVTTNLEIDDDNNDDLEVLLAKSRSVKQQGRKLMSADEIAHEIMLHQKEDIVASIPGGIVFDDTKDFLDSLQVILSKERAIEKEEEISVPGNAVDKPPKEEDLEETPTVDMAKETSDKSALIDTEHDGVSESPSFSSLLDTLKYLRQREQLPQQDSQVEKLHRKVHREAELSKIKISIEERLVKEELEKEHNYKAMSIEEQEKVFDRVLNERLVSKGIVPELGHDKYSRYNKKDSLAGYNPQVRLRYIDKSGHVLDTKQAWKHLLHKYHGLEPKNKKRKAVHLLKESVIR